MTPRRVLFVTHAYPRHATDGAGSFLHRLALGLVAAGLEVRVLAPAAPDLPDAAVLDGIPVRRYRYAPAAMQTLAYTGTMAEQVLGSISGKVALAGLIGGGTLALRAMRRDWRPDVVHVHWWFPSGLLAVAGAGETPVVTTLHGSDVRLARNARVAHPLMRSVLRRSARVTAVSAWLAGEARAVAPDAAITVAPMPADTAAFPLSASERPGDRILFVGRLNAQKGLRDLLEAVAWSGPQVTLDVVGDGPDREALHAQAAALSLGTRVRWHGQVTRAALPALYAAATATVMPSRDEGLGLVAVESQLCGTPVIGYASGGLLDVVDTARGGALVAPGDVRALADALANALAVARHARQDGTVRPPADREGLRAAMLARFAPEAVAAGYHALYRAAMAHA